MKAIKFSLKPDDVRLFLLDCVHHMILSMQHSVLYVASSKQLTGLVLVIVQQLSSIKKALKIIVCCCCYFFFLSLFFFLRKLFVKPMSIWMNKNVVVCLHGCACSSWALSYSANANVSITDCTQSMVSTLTRVQGHCCHAYVNFYVSMPYLGS